jgi:hypothetical protein
MGEGADQADKAKDESKISRIQEPNYEVVFSSSYKAQSITQRAILSRGDETCLTRIIQECLIYKCGAERP